MQYLEFKKINNMIQLVSDEPEEDWYNIPGENVFFQDDSLHFERFWGLEVYDGKFLPKYLLMDKGSKASKKTYNSW